uniref:Uncharacterized protein n=1 Tax=Aegilops tauschii TaxID=37682 RepID=M8BG41_AEGTA
MWWIVARDEKPQVDEGIEEKRMRAWTYNSIAGNDSGWTTLLVLQPTRSDSPRRGGMTLHVIGEGRRLQEKGGPLSPAAKTVARHAIS